MFFSHTFRLLFVAWDFFALITVVAMILSGVTFVLGITCRLEFGKNAKVLSRYCKHVLICTISSDADEMPNNVIVNRQDEETGIEKRDFSEQFGYDDKIEFPASDVPTYNAIMKRGIIASSSRPNLPPLAIPADAHTKPNSGSPFSSRSSSPSRADLYAFDDRTEHVAIEPTHSRNDFGALSLRSERSAPASSVTKKTWVIE